MLDPEYIQEQIAHEINRLGYSEEVAKTSIEYFFQYPGFGQSYTLGALWLSSFPRRDRCFLTTKTIAMGRFLLW